ncbi:MAG: GDP-mannose 4,6-dehydratase [Verrucomicrobiota bacterium]|nr:GDP-mannose 4,6-dehydratase [Verrucomicrobiota bacterium]
MKQDRHIMITGGAGFIGSHLTERLLSDGFRVTVIDDFSTGNPQNLAAVANNPRLKVIKSKVSSCANLAELVSECSAVFHLAAAVGVELVLREPIATLRTNLNETEAILSAACPARVPVLVASTSEVYGKSQKDEFSEDDDLLIGPPTLTRWSYACSKLMDEFLALAYWRERGLPVTIVRIFNTVGPRQTGRYGMVLPRFIAAAKSGKPIQVYGDGTQTRCFCDVADTVEALVRLQRSPEATGEIFNVGSDHEITLLDLARRVCEVLQSSSAIKLVPYEMAYGPGFEDMRRRKPRLAKLERVTGFRPATPLDAIIRRAAAMM